MGIKEILERKRQEREEAARRQKEIEEYKGPPLSLETALYLYLRASREISYDNFSDYRLLLEWLGPVEKLNWFGYIPPMLHSYEVDKLSKLTGTSPYEVYAVVKNFPDIYRYTQNAMA